jgi:PTH1 family peptidyl-tRNA hydrolase
VLHDELDIPAATNRIKFGGGDNGHNGLKSIRAAIGTGDFYRLRLGIGRPDQNQDPADFVLKKFSKAEKPEIELMVAKTSELLEMLIKEGLAATQNTFHANGELN